MVPQNIQNLVVTLGAKGHKVFFEKNVQHFNAPHVEEIISPSGAGDALTAAIAASILNNNKIIENNTYEQICEYVGVVLSQHCTYLRSSKKKIPYGLFSIWVFMFTASIICTIYCYFQNSELTIYLSFISVILAIGQIIRTEIENKKLL